MTRSTHEQPLKPGDQFERRFIIQKHLGTGNFSHVYRARQQICGIEFRQVALKLFNDRIRADNAYEVLNDIVVLSGLADECPGQDVDQHLVRIFDGGQALDGQPFLVMELVAGPDLGRLIRDNSIAGLGGVPLEMALGFLRQILLPLAWMHTLESPRAHGDLHPGNVLSTPKGQLKLADFGLATRLPGPLFGGAMTYQAPETLFGEPGNAYSDVYGVGMIAYEMLTGKPAFHSEHAEELALRMTIIQNDIKAASPMDEALRKALQSQFQAVQRDYTQELLRLRKQSFPPPSMLRGELRDHLRLEAIVLKALNYKPDQRFYHAAAMKKELDAYLAGQAVSPIHPEEEIPEPATSLLTSEGLLQEAWLLAERGDIREAHLKADQARGLEPRSTKGWLLKSRIALLESSGNPARRNDAMEEAFTFAQEAQTLASEDPLVLEGLALCFDAEGNHEMAAQMRRRATILRLKVLVRRRP